MAKPSESSSGFSSEAVTRGIRVRVDPQFDPQKRQNRWNNLRTAGKQRLEKQHAGFLDKNY